MEKKFNFNHRIKEENRILNKVSANSVTSVLQKEKLEQLYQYFKPNVEVIPPGVNIHRYKPLASGDKSPKTRLPGKYIYCLSRIDSNKGHDMLLKAFRLVLNKVPDANLVIGGGSANPKPREIEVFKMMKQIIKGNELEGHVRFVGYVPDENMAAYYQNAGMFVMPSLFEPFGMTTQEAMACGVPVIASKYGGIRSVITSGENGILTDPANQEEFAGEMIRLLEDAGWRQKIGRAGYELIREKYSWEVIARRHLDFYVRFAG